MKTVQSFNDMGKEANGGLPAGREGVGQQNRMERIIDLQGKECPGDDLPAGCRQIQAAALVANRIRPEPLRVFEDRFRDLLAGSNIEMPRIKVEDLLPGDPGGFGM